MFNLTSVNLDSFEVSSRTVVSSLELISVDFRSSPLSKRVEAWDKSKTDVDGEVELCSLLKNNTSKLSLI